MANFNLWARSNYFKIKHPDKYKKFIEDYGLNLITNNALDVELPNSLYGFLCCNEGIPDYIEQDFNIDGIISNKPLIEFLERNIFEELAEQLQEDQVAVVIEVGQEKLRYLGGIAIAVNSKGETVQIDLNDIYKQASEKFNIPIENIEEASY